MHLLTVRDVAALLRVSPRRVYSLTRLGVLDGIRLGRQLRWEEQALHDLVHVGGRPRSDVDRTRAREGMP